MLEIREAELSFSKAGNTLIPDVVHGIMLKHLVPYHCEIFRFLYVSGHLYGNVSQRLSSKR